MIATSFLYYTESPERWATANQTSHAVDKVELRLAFDRDDD